MATPYHIPFNKPAFLGPELEAISQAVQNGHLSGDGAFTRQCHTLLEKISGAAKALLTTSCTHALEMTALLLDVQPGDEVIIPSFTFVSTVNAFVLRGAHPVFADIRPDTLNLDENKLEALISPRTRAIIPMHYAGVGCEMDQILNIATAHHLMVIEDNAHGLFGAYRGKSLGSFGSLVGAAAFTGHVDADDLVPAFFRQFFVGFEVIAGTRAGGGRQEAGGHQPAQEFLPLDGDKVAQDLLSAMNVVGHRVDVQTFDQTLRNACTRIRQYSNISHRHSCFQFHCTHFHAKIVFFRKTSQKFTPAKVVIDLHFVCSYNTNMKIKFAGFFRPDHDPPLIPV